MALNDITGKRFGYLTVVERTENVGGRVAWLCQCDCGNTVTAVSRDLTRGKQTNCGCRRKKKGVEQLHYVEGTCVEMLQAKTVRKNSKSGITGVFYDESKHNWRAEISFKGHRYCLGRFGSIADAEKARLEAEQRLHEEFLNDWKLSNMMGLDKK